MSEVISLFVVCGDPGGAQAILPVVSKLITNKKYAVYCFAYRQGIALLQSLGVEVRVLPDNTDSEWLTAIFECYLPKGVLAATSLNGQDFEKLFFKVACTHNIPSIAVLDFWNNYRERFVNAVGELQYLPTQIAVMDEIARDEMIEVGFNPAIIQVTGHPGFDSLLAQRQQFSLSELEQCRRSLQIAPESILVIFASQPLAELYGSDVSHPRFLGYDERVVLSSLIVALESIAQHADLKIVLLIRPHPREQAEGFKAIHSELIRIMVTTAGDGRTLAMASDLVIGMTSMFLVESSFLGCPVLSVQPSLRSKNILPTHAGICIETVIEPSRLNQTVARYVMDTTQRAATRMNHQQSRLLPEPATERVLQCIDSNFKT